MPWATQRCQSIDFDPNILRDLPDDGGLHRFHVPGFDGQGFDILLGARQTWGESSIIWKMVADSARFSWGTAVYHKGVATLSFNVPGHDTYTIQPVYPTNATDGKPATYVILQKSPEASGTCGDCGVEHGPPDDADAAPDEALPEPGSPEASTSGTVTYIDVAMLYTRNVLAAHADNANSVEARALLLHSAANEAHARSGTKTRLRLVHLGLIGYGETGGLEVSLDELETNSFAQGVRNNSGADLLHMLVNNQGTPSSPNAVGRAITPGVHGVTKWDVGNTYVYAHETGHNIGCRHENQNTGRNSPIEITESWGFPSFSTQTQATIMWSSGSASSTIPMFSNPDRTWVMTGGDCGGLGDPACVDTEHTAGNAVTADMARFLRENRSGTADNRAPLMYLSSGAGSGGEATTLKPSNNLNDIVKPDGWMDETEAEATDNTQVFLSAGTYPAPIVLSKKMTIQKWTGAGNVVIGQ